MNENFIKMSWHLAFSKKKLIGDTSTMLIVLLVSELVDGLRDLAEERNRVYAPIN